jgi:two-component system, chemotaxis family, protein-glutamate methylesterase/glutaminase
VQEASEGVELRPGCAVLARGGIHLRIERTLGKLIGRLAHTPSSSPYYPSVDVLFESAAKAAGAACLGVVLTGMGDDGLLGSRAIVAAGGSVLTEAESSCVVYGMPRCVVEAGLSAGQARIDALGRAIVERL